MPAKEGEVTRTQGVGLGAVQGPSQGQRAHLGPPVGPSPECIALRTVVLRTPPDAWFGKKRMVGVTGHLTAWRGKKHASGVFFFLSEGKSKQPGEG